MGWASAGGIFDPMAQALIDLKASVEMKRTLLVKLIRVLRDGNWDTEDESLGMFRHDPTVVSAFYTALGGYELEGKCEGRIDYDEDNGNWVVECRRCGVLGSKDARLHDVEWSVAAHNELVGMWVFHDQLRHDGGGEMLEWALSGGDS